MGQSIPVPGESCASKNRKHGEFEEVANNQCVNEISVFFPGYEIPPRLDAICICQGLRSIVSTYLGSNAVQAKQPAPNSLITKSDFAWPTVEL